MRPWQSASPVPSAPLPKGGWHGEAVTGGFLPRTSCNLSVGAGFYPARPYGYLREFTVAVSGSGRCRG